MDYARREWLNPVKSEDTGAVSARVKIDINSIDGSIQLRDCGRQVDLNFGSFTPRVAKEKLKKAYKLKAVIDEFVLKLEEATKSMKYPRKDY